MPDLEREIDTMSIEVLNRGDVLMDDIDAESALLGEGLCLDSVYVWIPLLKSLDSIGALEQEQQTTKIFAVQPQEKMNV